jgi:hypothetical protein
MSSAAPTEHRALAQSDVLYFILQYLPTLSLTPLKPLSRALHRAVEYHQRRAAATFLARVFPSPHPGEARAAGYALEEAIFAGCGRRSGPGAYTAKLRSLSSALRCNRALAATVLAGGLAPAALARLPAAQLLTAEAISNTAAIRDAAFQRSRLPEPRANFFGVRCPCCGNDRLLREAYLSLGSSDATKARTKFTCVDCRRAVDVTPAEVMGLGLGAKRGREAEAEEGGGGGGGGGGAASARAARAAREAEQEEEEEEEGEPAVDLSGFFLRQSPPASSPRAAQQQSPAQQPPPPPAAARAAGAFD